MALIKNNKNNAIHESDHALQKRMGIREDEYLLFAQGQAETVWVVDPAEMKFLHIIGTDTGLRGFTAEELAGASLREQCTPECYRKAEGIFAEELARFYNGERIYRTFDVDMYHKDGSVVSKEVSARFYREKSGEIRIIGISKDINEQSKTLEPTDIKTQLILQLEQALAERDNLLKENKVLMGLLPICASCKRIRDENGKWWRVEDYISSRTNANFTHTICPVCKDNLYPELKK